MERGLKVQVGAIRVMIIFFSLFLILPSSTSDGQVLLKMDKFGKKKSLDFTEGDVITVRLKGEKDFRQLYIQKLYPDAALILTPLGPIKLEQIDRVRTFNKKRLAKYLKYQLWTFGAGWGLYSVIGALFLGEPWMWGTLFVVLGAAIIGWLLGFILRQRTYKIGGKRKLRIQNISFGKPASRS